MLPLPMLQLLRFRQHTRHGLLIFPYDWIEEPITFSGKATRIPTRMQLEDAFNSKHKICGDLYYAALLHEHPELLNDCCELINNEWAKSREARLRSIRGSSSDFPTSVLLLMEAKKPKVIGHSKLSKLPHSSPVIFVNSVVIHPKFRGKGLGRLLMQKVECYVKSKGIQFVYLSTMGQELFYEKLGYSTCNPLNIYGGQLNYTFPDNEKDELIQQENVLTIEKYKDREKLLETSSSSTSEETVTTPPLSPPPPPPPPPPPMNLFSPQIIHVTNKKTYMRKKII